MSSDVIFDSYADSESGAQEHVLFTEHLAELLKFSLGDKGCYELAGRLLTKFGNLDNVCSTASEELQSVEGMTRDAAILLRLCAALNSRRVTDTFELGKTHTTEEICRYFIALYMGLSVETVYMMLFDSRDRVISVEYMGEGTVSSSDVYPRKLLERAIKRGATSAILAHNHPRASSNASPEDVVVTQSLTEMFRSSGVELKGHYVVSERRIAAVPSRWG